MRLARKLIMVAEQILRHLIRATVNRLLASCMTNPTDARISFCQLWRRAGALFPNHWVLGRIHLLERAAGSCYVHLDRTPLGQLPHSR